MGNTADDVVYFRIKCPRVECQTFLPFDLSSHKYGACPICGKTPDDAYVTSMTYQLNHQRDPIILAWEPSPEDLLFTHPRSKCIPQDSLLIRGNDQVVVVFAAGGRRATLRQGTTYALSGESPDPDIGAIAKEIRAGGTGSALFPLHTKLVFFDTRIHHFQPTLDVSLPGGRWGIALPVHVSYRLDPEGIDTLLEHAIDFDRNEEAAKRLKDVIREYIGEAFSAVLRSVPTEKLSEANTADDVEGIIREVCESSFADVIREQRLLNSWGLSIVSLDPVMSRMNALDGYEYVECPFPRRIGIKDGKPVFDYDHVCGELNLVRKDAHAPFVCRACGRKVRWCSNCRPPRFTSDHRQRMICDKCFTKYTLL